MQRVYSTAEQAASADTGTGTIIAWVIFSVVVATMIFFMVKKWRGK